MNLKLDNIKVHGLAESIVASGLPMIENYDGKKFDMDSSFIFEDLENNVLDDNFKKHLERAKKLASCKGGESHDCFLAGIIVQMNVTAPRYFFPEMQRYHFIDIVSSTSTMHRLESFVKAYAEAERQGFMEKCIELRGQHFSPDTMPNCIDSFLICAKDSIKFGWGLDRIKANLPEGWLQTARVTTNYRQLRTIKRQRKNHRLNEWREFCKWIDSLPMAKELIQ